VVEVQARHLPRGSTVVMITPSAADVVAQTADLLMRRGLRPVVALLDSTSFGGNFSSERVATSLRLLRVPFCEIRDGDDLTQALSNTVSSVQKI
jgi:hypothetical protein